MQKENDLQPLIEKINVYSQNIRMEFDIEKCVMFIMKSAKRKTREGIELPNKDSVRT